MNRLCFSTRAFGLCCVAFLGLLPALQAGTTFDGFFDSYLVTGPFRNPRGAAPGIDALRLDQLCDGTTSENTIVPEAGLTLDPPDFAGCADPESRSIGNPVLTEEVTAGDLLDFNTLFGLNDNVMAYSWVYVENLADEPLEAILGIASDDSIQVKLNRNEVFIFNGGRGSGGAGTIQNTSDVVLRPGWNLLQFKVFEGGGGWNMRARLTDRDPVCPNPLFSGEGTITVTTERPDEQIPVLVEGAATRTITAVDGGPGRRFDVTVDVDADGPFTLSERFHPGWTVVPGSVTGGGRIVEGGILWEGVDVDRVGYSLTRDSAFSLVEARIEGELTRGNDLITVGGDSAIPGSASGLVTEVLVTPPLDGPGCTAPIDVLAGPWLGDGEDITDETIVPEEDLEWRPDFGSLESQALGVNVGLRGAARDRFWTDPDPFTTGIRLVKVSSSNAFYDWQRGDIFGAVDNAMCVAFFYAINRTDEVQFVNVGFGSDDSAVVKVNGRDVHTTTACRGHPGFSDKFRAALDPGKNLFSVYTFEGGGGFNMCIRFESEQGGLAPVETTVDATGYEPDPTGDLGIHPIHEIPGGEVSGFSAGGFITRYLVPADPLNQALGSSTLPGAAPEDYIAIDEDVPDVDNVREGATVTGGISGLITTGVRNFDDETELVIFDSDHPTWNPGDPGLFNGETFYGSPDNYSSTGFCFLFNHTQEEQRAFVGMASDDSAALYINGELILEHVGGRGFGGANAIQNGPAEVLLETGPNLLQLSYTEGGGGSGFRVGVWASCTRSRVFSQDVVEVCLDPDDCGDVEPPTGTPFVRGDANSDGRLNITDGIFILNFLFTGGDAPTCREASDTNADSRVNLTDGVYVLDFLFRAGPNIPAPTECAIVEDVDCERFAPCAN